MSNDNNVLPDNWKDILTIDHYANDADFSTPLYDYSNNEAANPKIITFNDDISSHNSVNQVSEGAILDQNNAITDSNNDIIPVSEGDSNNVTQEESVGSIVQVITRSGRISMKPKRLIYTTLLGLLSIKIGTPIH